jgi:hypothetical protein
VSDPDRPQPGTPEKFVSTPSFESEPIFSPDGRWIAYTESGTGIRGRVLVKPYPDRGGTWPISTGSHPFWSQTELFFISDDNRIMATPYSANSDSFPAAPHLWSTAPILETSVARILDIAPDGKRVAVLRTGGTNEENDSVHVTVLLNFFDWLRRRVPVR